MSKAILRRGRASPFVGSGGFENAPFVKTDFKSNGSTIFLEFGRTVVSVVPADCLRESPSAVHRLVGDSIVVIFEISINYIEKSTITAAGNNGIHVVHKR